MTTDRGVYRYLHIHWLVYTLISLFCQLRGPKSNRRAYTLVSHTFLLEKEPGIFEEMGLVLRFRAGNTQDAAGTLIMPENKKMFKKSTVYKIHLCESIPYLYRQRIQQINGRIDISRREEFQKIYVDASPSRR